MISTHTRSFHKEPSVCTEPKAVQGVTTLVLQASHDKDGVLRASRGFFQRNLKQLGNGGGSHRIVVIKEMTDIATAISSAKDRSIDFLYISAHGFPKEIQFTEDETLKAPEVDAFFSELPRKLKANATIYLSSCSTGSLEKDFYHNMQFRFGILTIDMPNVRVLAPSEDLHLDLIQNDPENGLQFEMVGETSYTNNIAICLDRETKAVLKRAFGRKAHLAAVKAQLLDSLVRIRETTYRINSLLKSSVLDDVSHDTSLALTKELLCAGHDSDKSLSRARFYVEELGVDPNARAGFTPLSPQCASPLFAAVHFGHGRLVAYLLENGADAAVRYKELSPVDYAKTKEHFHVAQLLEEWDTLRDSTL